MFCEQCKELLEQLELAGRKLTAAAICNLHGVHVDSNDRQQRLSDALEMNAEVRMAYELHRESCGGIYGQYGVS